MTLRNRKKFTSLLEFWEYLPGDERIITDILRQIVLETLPLHCKEKLTYNVPFFYGKRRICVIWPASVPGGGITSGVLFGFCQGNKLSDKDGYLIHGNNKQIYYKIFHSAGEIEIDAITVLLKQAMQLDNTFK
jgi:hypothetical protein